MDERADSFANRLAIAMELKKINQIELAENTKIYNKKISQSLINKYLKGKALARQDNIYILSKILNVDEAWLMGFNVPMKRTPDEERTNSNIFQYTAVDSSMSPLLDVGDIAFIERTKNVKSGQTIFFRLNDLEYIRKIIINENAYEFIAINPYFPVMKFSKEDLKKQNYNIIGRVIKVELKSAFK